MHTEQIALDTSAQQSLPSTGSERARKKNRHLATKLPGCRKISPLQRKFILNLAGQYRTVPQITELLKTIHGVSLTKPTVLKIIHTDPEEVEKYRSEYLASTKDIPIAQSKVRLERAEVLYECATTIENKKDMVDAACRVLKEAREETQEKKADMIAGDMNFMQFNFNNVSDKDLMALEHKLKKDIIDVSVEKVKTEAKTGG